MTRACLGIAVLTALTLGAVSPVGAQGQSAGRWVDELNTIIARELADKEFPSFALVLVNRDGVVAEVAQGYRTWGGQEPVTPKSVYRTGSVGKTLTDLAVMAAMDQGLINLDEDVRRYLPEFQPRSSFEEPITLRFLMTHQAGLVREPPVGHYFDDGQPSLEQTVTSLNATSLLWAPGTRTKYSNAGLAVVGRVLEVVFRRTYQEVIEALVFAPAGMITARVGLSPILDSLLARGVMWQPGRDTVWEAPLFDLGMAPAGDHYASIRDMAALLRALLAEDGRIVRPETFEQMWSPYPRRDVWHIDVGLGFSLNGKFADQYRMARNGGAVYGYSTELALLPEEGLGVYAVAAKDMSNGTVQAIAHWALRAYLSTAQGRAPPAYELTPKPFAGLADQLRGCVPETGHPTVSRLLGLYGWTHNPLLICEKNGQLHALIEWFFLYPLSERQRDVFEFPSWSLYSHEQLWFLGGEDEAQTVVLGHGSAGVRFPRLRDVPADDLGNR